MSPFRSSAGRKAGAGTFPAGDGVGVTRFRIGAAQRASLIAPYGLRPLLYVKCQNMELTSAQATRGYFMKTLTPTNSDRFGPDEILTSEMQWRFLQPKQILAFHL